MYSSQPVSYSYGTPTASTTGSLQSGYISPPESRRALDEENEKQQAPPQRQSLPSIHEALGNDNPLPYHTAPTSAPPPQVHPHHHAPPHPPPHTSSPGFVGRSAREGPPNPFNPAFPHHQLQTEASRSSLTSLNTQDSRNTSLHSLNSAKSPTQSAKTGVTSISGPQVSPYEYNAPASSGNVASPSGYAPPFSQSFAFSSQPPPNAPSYPSAPYEARNYPGTPWKPTPEQMRMEEMKNGYASRPPLPGHNDSMKRHLEVYDVENSLNEVCFSSLFFFSPNMCFEPVPNWHRLLK